jgi:N-acetylglucosamine kinase-like BadF-type ATPase
MKAFVGVDGGGSKTRAVIVRESGELIADLKTEGSNVNHFGWERAQSILQELFVQIRKSLPSKTRIESIFLGLAGIDRSEERRKMGEWISSQWPGVKVGVENDAVPALVSGAGDAEGIVLIGGTGSIAFGMNDRGEQCRVGGWGYLIGDEGSGYDIGKEACAAVLKSYDGRGEKTLLTDKILAHYQIESPTSLIPLVYSNEFTREQMAAMTRFVFEAAQDGDPVSLSLLNKAADELSDLVHALMARLTFAKERVPVVLTGGLFHEGSLLISLVRERLPEHIEVVRSEHPPVAGAVIMSYRQAGRTPGVEFAESLRRIK